MGKIERWLEDEPQGRRLVRFITIVVIFELSRTLATVLIFSGLNSPSGMIASHAHSMQDMVLQYPLRVFFLAWCEETLFRFPLFFFLMLRRNWLTFVAVIVFSAIFGYAHHGLSSLPYQGIGGFVLSIVFIRCGGWRWGRSMDPLAVFKGIACSTLVHGFYNIGIALVILLL